MTNVHMYVVCDRDVDTPQSNNIQLIRADRTDGMNISDKSDYCELRAQYWVWKNMTYLDTDSIGFFHYRRYLDLYSSEIAVLPNEKRPVPYRICKSPTNKQLGENIKKKINSFDVIAPTWEYTGISVWKRYGFSSRQRISDLAEIYQIISEKYSDYKKAAEMYLNGRGEYFGNIYIMKWEYFKDYCEWMFDILCEFDKRVKEMMPFTDGYLGERLFGIYFTWLISQGNALCGEIPRVHYSIYDDATHNFKRERVVNYFLPPGSRLRGVVRKARYHIGELALGQ